MSDVRIEKVTAEAFEEVLPLLAPFEKNNPHLTSDRWRRLFHYPWKVADDTRGFVLRDGGRIGGFVGTLLSERLIAGNLERFCNITSWIVLPEFRAHSFPLMAEALADTDATITGLTSPAEHARMNALLGYQPLETHLRIILPRPNLRRLAAGLRCRSAELEGEERRLCEDHRQLPCRQLSLTDGSKTCHVVFTRTKGRRYWFSHVHHISDPEFFLGTLERWQWAFFRAHGTVLTMIDERLVAGRDIPGSRLAALPTPRLFMSPRLRPEQIDNLYTELVVLGL